MLLLQILADSHLFCKTDHLTLHKIQINYLTRDQICAHLQWLLVQRDYSNACVVLKYVRTTKRRWTYLRTGNSTEFVLWLIFNNHRKMLLLLINKQYVTLYQLRENGCLLFLMACFHGRAKITNMFFNQGFTIKDLRANNCTPFLSAIENGHLKIVKLLVKKGLTIQDIRGTNNFALFLACSRGRLPIVKFLIQQGLTKEDIQSQDNRIIHMLRKKHSLESKKIFYFMAKMV